MPYNPAGVGWACSLGKVRKAQKPGKKDLLGVNTAFSFKIEFCPLRFFFIGILAGITPRSEF